MNTDQFFDLLLEEIKQNENLRGYYRFLNHPSPTIFNFRKAYYMQRLDYIARHINQKGSYVWDLGCGYGTTAIYLALNGIKVYGTTIEYYFDEIEKRMPYWQQFGDISGATFEYKNIFKQELPKDTYDYVIVQDVLHHIEPIDEGLEHIRHTLKPGGVLVSCEENGKNIINRLKLYKQRGNRRIVEITDEKTGEKVLLGNENIRSIKAWTHLLANHQMKLDKNSLEYVRVMPPTAFKNNAYDKVIQKENRLWKKNRLLRDYFYFGINFLAYKS